MSELLIDPSVSGRKNSAKSCICIVQLVDALGCSCRWPSNNCRAHLRDSDSIPGTTIRSPQIRKSEQISHSNGKYLQRQMNAKTRRRVAEMRKLQNKCAKKYFSGPRTIRGGGCCFFRTFANNFARKSVHISYPLFRGLKPKTNAFKRCHRIRFLGWKIDWQIHPKNGPYRPMTRNPSN